MDSTKFLIIGSKGQLGRALHKKYPNAQAADIEELDITDAASVNSYDWSNVDVIINAAAYTNVDGAETPEGSAIAWNVNDKAAGYLADIAHKNGITFVHVSTADVFDGKKKLYSESDVMHPLGVYAKSKAAGDEKILKTAKHYIVRTDSVIGEGKNFVLTMLDVAKKGIAPTVVADQFIRPTFTNVLVDSIVFLLEKEAPFGIYNVTNEGEVVSWADFTREIYKQAGVSMQVTDTTFAEYFASKSGVAPRPLNSVLDLRKIEMLGFKPHDWHGDLKEYLAKERLS